MKYLIESIRDALEKDCLLPALMSALVIPDAMGQCLYPELVDKKSKKRLIGQQYKRWFRDWVGDRLLFSGGCDGENESSDTRILTEEMCWQLRCSLLHSGDYDVTIYAPERDESFDYNYKFELVTHGCNALRTSWAWPEEGERSTKSVVYRINAADLSSALCDAAELCLMKTGNEVVYPELDLLDLS